MNEEIEQYIIDFCTDYILELPEEYEVIVLKDCPIVSTIDNLYYRTIFDVCFFRDDFIYDVTEHKEIPADEYANRIIDDQFSRN